MCNDSGASPESSQTHLVRAAPRHPGKLPPACLPRLCSALHLSHVVLRRIGRHAGGKALSKGPITVRGQSSIPTARLLAASRSVEVADRAPRSDGPTVGSPRGDARRSDTACRRPSLRPAAGTADPHAQRGVGKEEILADLVLAFLSIRGIRSPRSIGPGTRPLTDQAEPETMTRRAIPLPRAGAKRTPHAPAS